MFTLLFQILLKVPENHDEEARYHKMKFRDLDANLGSNVRVCLLFAFYFLFCGGKRVKLGLGEGSQMLHLMEVETMEIDTFIITNSLVDRQHLHLYCRHTLVIHKEVLQ